MFASKLAVFTCKTPLVGNAFKLSLHNPTHSVVRSFRGEAGRKFGLRRSRIEEVQEKLTPKAFKQSVGPLQVGQVVAAGSGVLGLGALCFYGLGLSNETGAIDRMYIWPTYVRTRIRDTYLYFGASVAVTAASAVALFRSPLGHKYMQFCQRHPIMSMIGMIGALVASGQMMMSIPYSTGIGPKQLMWLVNCGMIGLAIAPIASFGGAIAIRAAWYTAGLVGGLTTVAVCAPSEKFLNWAGPLGLGLGGVIIASIGSAFLPPTSALGLSLFSISIYGGLVIFSALLLYDTQKVMKSAEHHPPPNAYGVAPFDPINASHRIVMDAVNIFIRLVQILAMGSHRK